MTKYCILLLFTCFFFQSCCYDCYDDDFDDYVEYSEYEPIFWSRADLDSTIRIMPPREIVNSGKIYVIGDILFVGEKREGFHVFDNSDTKNPQNINFIQAIGSTDIAMRDTVMYINQATDLITLKYSISEENLELVKRIQNTFPDLTSPDGFKVYDISEDSVVIEWVLKN